MPVTDILLPLGRAVVTSAVHRWLANRRDLADRSLPLVELVNRPATDGLTRRKAEREMERMVDSVLARLQPLIAGRFGDLPENELQAVLHAVTDTFSADPSDLAVFDADANPTSLARKIRESSPARPVRAFRHRLRTRRAIRRTTSRRSAGPWGWSARRVYSTIRCPRGWSQLPM